MTDDGLSDCLTQVQSELGDKAVDAIELMRTICKKHLSVEPKLDNVYKLLGSAGDAPPNAPRYTVREWNEQLRERLVSTVKALHTKLALLTLGRIDAAVEKALAAEVTVDGTLQSAGAALRGGLWEFFPDLDAHHEVKGEVEFHELLDNKRGWETNKDREHGRNEAAVLFSSDENLEVLGQWFTRLFGHEGVGYRYRVTFDNAVEELARGLSSDWSAPPHYQLGSFSPGTIASDHPDLDQLIDAAENTLGVSSRFLLLVELSDCPSDPEEFRRGLLALQARFASRGKRIAVVIGGINTPLDLEFGADRPAYYLAPAMASAAPVKFSNDLAGGPDLLNVKHEAEALADAMASKRLEPPLVVGICGGWGSGKSFILNLIEERLHAIRQGPPPLNDEHALHVGHIYHIRFDAWAYSKESIWASLMDRIFNELELQLNVERIQQEDQQKKAKDIRIPLNLSPWRVTNELIRTELERLNDDKSYRLVLEENKKGLSNFLVEPAGVEEQVKDIQRRLQAVPGRRRELERQRQQKVARRANHQYKERLLAQLPASVLAHTGLREQIDGAINRAKSEAEVIDDVKELIENVRSLGWDSATVKGFVVVTLCSLIGVLWLDHLDWVDISKQGWLAPASSAFATIVAWWNRHSGTVKSAVQGLQKGLSEQAERMVEIREAVRKNLDEEDQKATKRFSETTEPPEVGNLAELDAYEQSLKASLEEKERSLAASLGDGKNLSAFLGNISAGNTYRRHLDLMHEAQQHLRELSRRLLHTAALVQQKNKKFDGHQPFLRGEPRIVLVIDDLDRCPPPKVVEVLEAAQLLVKTRLFVVVMALDLRYVTRALEKEYEKILQRDEPPTGLDYIEKIIQIPYRVRPMQGDQYENFFSKQLDVMAPERTQGTTGGKPEQPEQQTGRTVRVPKLEPQSETLMLTHDEFQWLVESCAPLRLSPRATKRIANVYKVWKLIWHSRGTEPLGQREKVHRAMVALLALSTLRPRLARAGLDQLEHARARNESPNIEKKFHELAKRLGEPEYVSEALTKGELLPSDLHLSGFPKIDFDLLSSFSFIGDDTTPLDQIPHMESLRRLSSAPPVSGVDTTQTASAGHQP